MSTTSFPTYITELVQRALQKACSTNCSFNELEQPPALQVQLATQNGDNFCSQIYRVYLKCKTIEKHFIVKDITQEIVDIGSSERLMYESILPKMENIFSESGQTEKLSPTCFHATDVPHEAFVLEDLDALGYKTADRWIGLDAEHTKILLQKIAKFHAVSMVFMEQFPAEAAGLQSSNFAKGTTDDLGSALVNKGIESAIKIVENWQGFSEIATKMRKSIEDFDDRVKMLVDPAKASINVINHGDLWVNNFLYSYKNNKPTDVVFVDFQNNFIGSPATDLNYFLYTSVQLPLLKTKLNDFLQIYYDTFSATLRHFNYANIPSFEELQSEMRRCAFFGYYAAVCELPICCMSKEASFGFTQATFKDPEKLAKKHLLMFDNCERVLETFRYTLTYFNDLGILD